MTPFNNAWTNVGVVQFWQVTLVIALVAFIAKLLGRRSHLVYLLWLVVLVKCLTPPIFSSPTSVFSWAGSPRMQANEPVDMPFQRDFESSRELDDVVLPSTVPEQLASPEMPPRTSAAAALSAVSNARWSVDWRWLVFATWLGGAGLYLAFVVRVMVAWSRLVRQQGESPEPSIDSLFDNLARQLRIRRPVRLIVLSNASGPLTYGWLRPVVVLPQYLLASQSTEELKLLLAHELVHVRRGDALAGLVQVAVQAVWWFHPGVWWANAQILRVREQCCDEEVVASLTCSPAQYGRCLLGVLNQRQPQKTSFALPGIRSFEVTRRRLERLLRLRAPRPRTPWFYWPALAIGLLLLIPGAALTQPAGDPGVAAFGPLDWPQWGGSSQRNNVPNGVGIPTQWSMTELLNNPQPQPGQTQLKWSVALGTQCYTSPVIAGGQVYVGTNNGANYVPRYPAEVDLGVLLCFRESDGKFLWQHSNEKLPTGRVQDLAWQGVCSIPLVEGNRLWYVTNRGEVVCLDAAGFHDNVDNGAEQLNRDRDEADVIWKLDMMSQLGTSHDSRRSCSVTTVGDILFVNTANGVDQGQRDLPAPNAPSFIALNKNTGALLWADNSPGANVLNGQWSSPAYAVLGGVPQAIFGGGDGWLYSFRGDATQRNGRPELLWKFDCNPKDAKYVLGGRATRNHVIGTPVIYEGLVYIGVGEDPEHGEGIGHLWCVDPTKRGDVSSELVFNSADPMKVIAHKRVLAVDTKVGDFVKPNANSAVVWNFDNFDANKNGKIEFLETMHRTCGTVAIANDLLFVADFCGLFHCLDAKTGVPYWSHDLLAATWGSPLIVEDKVYIGDEDGDIAVFRLSKDKTLLAENTMSSSVYSTPVVANNTLFITDKSHLYALELKRGQ